MSVLEVLVTESVSVDRLASSAISAREVSSLDHEVLDNTMERASLEVQGLSTLALSLLTSAKSSTPYLSLSLSPKVLRSLGSVLGVISLQYDVLHTAASQYDQLHVIQGQHLHSSFRRS